MQEQVEEVHTMRWWRYGFILAFFIVLISLAFAHFLTMPEKAYPLSFTVTPGSSVATIVKDAHEAGLVRSEFLLYVLMNFVHSPESVYAGTYVFDSAVSPFEVARKLAEGDIESELVALTLPEGISRKEIAKIATRTLTNFDEQIFLELTRGLEGKLFPETYFVSPSFTPKELKDLLLKTFDDQTQGLHFENTSHSKEKVLILASIIEREANDEESMRMVSGILQNRLAIDMPLQADASIEYVLDKPLKELTPEDLKIDSPYNTYLNKGLPPTPIGNPGRASIDAVLYPEKSEYLFYITGNDGVFYYAKTYEEHLKNIERHLK